MGWPSLPPLCSAISPGGKSVSSDIAIIRIGTATKRTLAVGHNALALVLGQGCNRAGLESLSAGERAGYFTAILCSVRVARTANARSLRIRDQSSDWSVQTRSSKFMESPAKLPSKARGGGSFITRG